jgi:hypothetical protein
MSGFLAPLALSLLALLPVIVVLYLLKLKRRPVRVSSTLLWRRSVQDMVANAPFQKLRNNLLLWLQLLALLLLVLALARPVGTLGRGQSETIILLLDLSASMQTVEENGRTRLDLAKELALKAVDNMSGGTGFLSGFGARDEMMVIGFADKTFPLQPVTNDRGALRNAIISARAFDTEANIEDAAYILQERTMVMRGDALEPNPNARVLIISDGGIGPSVDSLADIKNIDFALVGKTTNNVGITRVDLRESYTGQLEQQLFTNLYNATEAEFVAYVELTLAGAPADMKRVAIPARASASTVFNLPAGVTGVATVQLSSHRDAFPADDSVNVVIQPPTEIRVLLVTRGNPFLEKIFSIDPRARVEVVRPDAFAGRDGFDITVFDSFSPPDLAQGNFIFVNAMPPPGAGFRAEGDPVANPRIIDWSRVHPLTRFANFEPVALASARPFTLPRDGQPLVETAAGPLIAIHETDTRRILVIGFDILKSYWPLDLSFPIFFGNLIEDWSRSRLGATRGTWPTGSTIPIVLPRDASRLAVSTPDGQRVSFDVEGQPTHYLTQTSRRGLYTISFGSLDVPLAVALFSQQESDVAPIEKLEVGSRTVEAQASAVQGRQELWPWIALLGLLILSAEWLIYCRRTFM